MRMALVRMLMRLNLVRRCMRGLGLSMRVSRARMVLLRWRGDLVLDIALLEYIRQGTKQIAASSW